MRKEKWWQTVYADWKAKPWFYISVLLGSSVVASGITSYIVNWPNIYGENWLDALTAFGTVGAVIVALIFGLRTEIERALTRKYRHKFIRAKINDRLSAYLVNLEHVIRATHGLERINRMAMLRLTRLWWIEDISDTDVLELSSFYADAYQLIEARERMLLLMKIGNVPRECLREDIPYYRHFYRSLKSSGGIKNLADIWHTLSTIKAVTRAQ